ncbi:outer membrane beta-barrel protein [Paraflavitalea speifideaquila]|uniref:outer membrane beta-barrel protein n=1 Tax=Paraflavitalea speifideaquila TaxID=3076558 RepID=UPI0028ECEDA8|nr:outer membrane beta-barrel protein [Paraflavitalea speifideiaquila]
MNNRQQFIRDTILNTRTNRNENIASSNHRINFSLRMKVNPSTRIDFRPGFVLSDQHSDRFTTISTVSNKNGLLNRSNNQQGADGKDIGYNHILSVIKTFKKKGRTFSFYQLANFNRTDNDQINAVQNILYPDDTLYINQLRNRMPANTSVNTTLTYNEPLFKNTKIRLVYALQFLDNKDRLTTYYRNNSSGKYDELNETLSNSIFRNTWRNSFSAAWVWSFKDLTITGSANYQHLALKYRPGNSNKFQQNYNYLFPGIAIDWKELNVEYSASVTPPAISDVQTVPDNTNPLYVIKGNPDLQPVVVHNIYLNFYKSIPSRSLSISAYLNANLSRNGVVRSRTVDETGIQTTYPVNASGLQHFVNQASINKQYRLDKGVQLVTSIGYSLNYYRNLIIVNSLKGFVNTTDLNGFVRTGINWKDKIEWNLGVSKGIYNTRYERNDFDNLTVNRYGISTDVVIRWPRKNSLGNLPGS